MTEIIGRILVPVDFSAHSERAVRYAASLAGQLGATLELVHVVEDPFTSGAWNPETFIPNVEELLEGLMGDAEQRLQTLKATVTDRVGVKTTVLIGRPSHAIVKYAEEAGAHLIVMGSHGRTGLAHIVMGSVAERVSREAYCPVLTVRDTEVTHYEGAPESAAA
jgi:nucleotide-binding universal stress UspA family protein